jgi:hypothetical protein
MTMNKWISNAGGVSSILAGIGRMDFNPGGVASNYVCWHCGNVWMVGKY